MGKVGKAVSNAGGKLAGNLANAAGDAKDALAGAVKGATGAAQSAAGALADGLSDYVGGSSNQRVMPRKMSPKHKANKLLAGRFGPSLATKGLGSTNAKNILQGKPVDTVGKKALQSLLRP